MPMHLVRLDINSPVFLSKLFGLQKSEQTAVLATLKKISSLTWPQVYQDSGLKWEKIHTAPTVDGVNAIYSLRISVSCRATAYREGDFMRFVSIFSDHDATYGKK